MPARGVAPVETSLVVAEAAEAKEQGFTAIKLRINKDLREARERAGITLREVAASTKISVPALEAPRDWVVLQSVALTADGWQAVRLGRNEAGAAVAETSGSTAGLVAAALALGSPLVVPLLTSGYVEAPLALALTVAVVAAGMMSAALL